MPRSAGGRLRRSSRTRRHDSERLERVLNAPLPAQSVRAVIIVPVRFDAVDEWHSVELGTRSPRLRVKWSRASECYATSREGDRAEAKSGGSVWNDRARAHRGRAPGKSSDRNAEPRSNARLLVLLSPRGVPNGISTSFPPDRCPLPIAIPPPPGAECVGDFGESGRAGQRPGTFVGDLC